MITKENNVLIFFFVRVCRDLFSYLSRVWDKVLKVICIANEGECLLTDPWRYCLLLTNSNKYSMVLSERSFLSI